MWGEFLWKW